MKKRKLKEIIVVALSLALSSSMFIGCGEKKESVEQNESVVSEEEKVNEEEEDKKEDENEEEDIKKDEADSEKDSSVEAGYITKKALPGFEEVFKNDSQKDFKIKFANEGLAELDKLYEAIPSELADEYFDSKKVFEQEAINKKGTSKIFNFQSSLGGNDFSAENNIAGVSGDISFNDQKEILNCTYNVKAIFKTGKEKTIKLNEEAIKLIEVVIGDDLKDINIQEKFDEAYKTEKIVVLKEDKYETVKICPAIYTSGNSVRVYREKRVDYPMN